MTEKSNDPDGCFQKGSDGAKLCRRQSFASPVGEGMLDEFTMEDRFQV